MQVIAPIAFVCAVLWRMRRESQLLRGTDLTDRELARLVKAGHAYAGRRAVYPWYIVSAIGLTALMACLGLAVGWFVDGGAWSDLIHAERGYPVVVRVSGVIAFIFLATSVVSALGGAGAARGAALYRGAIDENCRRGRYSTAFDEALAWDQDLTEAGLNRLRAKYQAEATATLAAVAAQSGDAGLAARALKQVTGYATTQERVRMVVAHLKSDAGRLVDLGELRAATDLVSLADVVVDLGSRAATKPEPSALEGHAVRWNLSKPSQEAPPISGASAKPGGQAAKRLRVCDPVACSVCGSTIPVGEIAEYQQAKGWQHTQEPLPCA